MQRNLLLEPQRKCGKMALVNEIVANLNVPRYDSADPTPRCLCLRDVNVVLVSLAFSLRRVRKQPTRVFGQNVAKVHRCPQGHS